MAYANLDELIEYLKITDNSDNVLLESNLLRAQKSIESLTDKTFEASADTTLSFDSDIDVDGPVLSWAPYNLWLAAITTVTNGDSTVITSAQYVTEPRRSAPYYALRILDSTGLAWEYPSNGNPEDAISITGRWAYMTTPDDDIVQATLRLASWFYRQRDNAEMDRSLIVGNATILPSQMPRDIMEILEPYMRRI